MKAARKTLVALFTIAVLGAGTTLVADQTRPRVRQIDSVAPALEVEQLEPVEFFRYSHRSILRIWQDYVLKSDDAVRQAVVIFGTATIDGRVDGDLVVVFGEAKLASTAVVHGSVVVVAGDVTIAQGASVRQDLVVIGGATQTPADFSPGGEHVIVGRWLGDQMRAVVPWFTRGLLWGRVIVPGIGWVWTVLAIVFLISLLINQGLHGAVGACADTLAAKPFTTFLVGILVLLLTGPLSLLLAVTVVGLVVEPFLWAALFIGWMIGKVGVARWIGRSLTGQAPPETHATGFRSFLIGFVVISLLYMIPVLGLMTWALVGVFGLGAATQSFLGAIRRERPAPPPKRTPVPPAPPLPDLPSTPGPPAGIAGAPAGAAFTAIDPASIASTLPPAVTAAGAGGGSAAAAMDPVMPGAPGGSNAAAAPTDLLMMPRATLLDRLAAVALDVLLVLMVRSLFGSHGPEPFFILLFAYYVGALTWKGTTLGGIICNLRVIRTDGQPLGPGDAVVRSLAAIFSFAALGLGFLWIAKDPERQAWHDRIAGTYVVAVPRSWPLP
jgi:uncharacterized RDD family membrane protein YckC